MRNVAARTHALVVTERSSGNVHLNVSASVNNSFTTPDQSFDMLPNDVVFDLSNNCNRRI